MNIETFISLSMFSFVTSITPGPNNIMLLASGMNFGLKRTMPHALGVSIGFLVMLIAVGMGVGALIKSSEIVYNILKYLGIAYLLWLAWKTTISRSVGSAKNSNEKTANVVRSSAVSMGKPKSMDDGDIGYGPLHRLNEPL